MIRTLLAWSACLVLLACGGGGGGGGGGGTPPFVSSNPCDAGLTLTDADPVSAAHALGICDGLVTAAWILPDAGVPPVDPTFHVGHGIASDFGPNNPATEGSNLLILSSGAARRETDPGFQPSLDKGFTSGFPANFPQDNPACPSVVPGTPHDGIALRVVLTVPAGVGAFSFDYAFFTRDHPTFECSTFADVAAATVLRPGVLPTNVLLDPAGHSMVASPVSMQACTSCPLGTGPLAGTGYEAGGGSGLLHTGPVAVTAGTTIEIQFAVWDSGDGQQDSTVILDGFTWIPAP